MAGSGWGLDGSRKDGDSSSSSSVVAGGRVLSCRVLSLEGGP